MQGISLTRSDNLDEEKSLYHKSKIIEIINDMISIDYVMISNYIQSDVMGGNHFQFGRDVSDYLHRAVEMAYIWIERMPPDKTYKFYIMDELLIRKSVLTMMIKSIKAEMWKLYRTLQQEEGLEEDFFTISNPDGSSRERIEFYNLIENLDEELRRYTFMRIRGINKAKIARDLGISRRRCDNLERRMVRIFSRALKE